MVGKFQCNRYHVTSDGNKNSITTGKATNQTP